MCVIQQLVCNLECDSKIDSRQTTTCAVVGGTNTYKEEIEKVCLVCDRYSRRQETPEQQLLDISVTSTHTSRR